jgi:uncharacterized protein (TIGR01777 family)
MRVLITGSTGLVGSALVPALRSGGHDVVRLVRRTPSEPDEVRWDPAGGQVDRAGLSGVDAVVHLAGAGVGERRWTEAYKRTIRDSRVLGTRTLVRALGELPTPPQTLISASAIGWYGERGDEVLIEGSPPGEGFLAGVVRDWEAEALAAEQAGIRVVTVRSGLIMSRTGGAFGRRLLPLTKLGLGGPLGNGRQWWSWITLEDQVNALRFLLENPLKGAVNVTGPEPARQRDVAAAIAHAAHRPSAVPAPAFALRLVLGEFSGEILGSQRVLPTRLRDAGFTFRHDHLDAAAAWLVS